MSVGVKVKWVAWLALFGTRYNLTGGFNLLAIYVHEFVWAMIESLSPKKCICQWYLFIFSLKIELYKRFFSSDLQIHVYVEHGSWTTKSLGFNYSPCCKRYYAGRPLVLLARQQSQYGNRDR